MVPRVDTGPGVDTAHPTPGGLASAYLDPAAAPAESTQLFIIAVHRVSNRDYP